MPEITYHIVEHDGGWAYKLGDVFSETFPTHDAALHAAKTVADKQQLAGVSEEILYQDAKGSWHEEYARGTDRPHTTVED